MSPILESFSGISARGYGFTLPALNGNSFESISTVTVGAGGASTITFSSIPSTYKHLQVRCTVIPIGGDNMTIRFNGDTANNYSCHQMQGDGSTVQVASDFSSQMYLMGLFQSGSSPFVGVYDFLDYGSTNKYKTVRGLVGTNDNSTSTSFRVGFHSGLWQSTTAVNSITMLSRFSSGFGQYSSFALYGVKG